MRLLFGFMIVTQYMVLEGWLNEQTENRLRGRVFSIYMVVSGMGTVLGQLILTVYHHVSDNRPFTLVAIFATLCLAPLASQTRASPAALEPAGLELAYYLRQARAAILAIFLAGCLNGSFSTLAVVYMVKLDYTAAQAASYVAAASACGLLSQWPMGWLSDRYGREKLIRFNTLLLAALGALLWGWAAWPYWLMLGLACAHGALQLTLYPMASALANDRVEPARRVSLSAVLLIAHGVGACIGPLAAGLSMALAGPWAFYVFVSLCALTMAWRVRFRAAG
jgi:MFS family permease